MFCPRLPSRAMAVALLAVFLNLAGVAYAATGGNFILGQANTANQPTTLTGSPATGAALAVANTTSGQPAASFTVSGNKAPFTVSSSGKVGKLNADKLDGLDSTDFLRNFAPLSLTGSVATDGVLSGTNTGSANGVQGITSSGTASGVYGQNDGGGFGVAGRSLQPGGVGVLADGTAHGLVANGGTAGLATIDASNGSGPALALHSVGAPMTVDSAAKVANLNADLVDGASIVSNRVISTTQGDHVLDIPGFGFIYVDGCDHTNTRWIWTSNGTGAAYVTVFDVANAGDGVFQGAFSSIVSATRPHEYDLLQLARNTGGATSIAQVTLTTDAAPCVFAASAIVQPG